MCTSKTEIWKLWWKGYHMALEMFNVYIVESLDLELSDVS